MYKSMIKPFLDFMAALVLLLIITPIMAITALVILIKLGHPIMFAQPRPGYKGKIFTIYKFRTMNDSRDVNGELLSDEKRLKGIGKVIRGLSLDELPQLFNVLKGEMSFVGPRPLLTDYLPLYTSEQSRRHEVKPGITGLAQINGRNAISWEEKFCYDVEYVDTMTFLLDLKIIFLTFLKVLKKEGVSQKGKVTMEKFLGNPTKNREDNA